MLYLLDYSNFTEIKKTYDIYTTANAEVKPVINLKENKKFINTLKEIRETAGTDTFLHVQIIGDKAEKIFETAKMLKKNIGGNLYIKTSDSLEGLKAVKLLSKEGIFAVTAPIFMHLQLENTAKAEYTVVKILEEDKTVYKKIINKLLCLSLPNTKGNGLIYGRKKI